MIVDGKQNIAQEEKKERMHRYKNLERKIFHNQGQSSAQPYIVYNFISVSLCILLLFTFHTLLSIFFRLYTVLQEI